MDWLLLALAAAGVGLVLLLAFLLVWLAVPVLGFLTGKTFGDLLLPPPHEPRRTRTATHREQGGDT